MFEHTKQICDQIMKMGTPCIDLIVYKDGKCVLRHMDGYADPENKVPMTGKEKYHIYSCSKLITCVAAMQLWEQGKFSLEDKLSDYLPAFGEMYVKTEDGVRKAEKPILIHHLFSMTAGFNYAVLWTPEVRAFCKEDGYRCRTVDFVNQLAKMPLESEPGEQWRYSVSHDILAALVEIWSGENFETYVQKNICKPLGMKNTTFLHPMEDWEGFARQFKYMAEENRYAPWWRNIYRVGKEYCSGGAGAVSTVDDYIKFLEALRVGDVILKKETVALMATDRLTDGQRKTYTYGTSDIGYGLGMRAYREGSRRTEFGWGGAAGAFASVNIPEGVSIFYVQHVLNSPVQQFRNKVYDAVIADLRGEALQITMPELPNDPAITY